MEISPEYIRKDTKKGKFYTSAIIATILISSGSCRDFNSNYKLYNDTISEIKKSETFYEKKDYVMANKTIDYAEKMLAMKYFCLNINDDTGIRFSMAEEEFQRGNIVISYQVKLEIMNSRVEQMKNKIATKCKGIGE